MNPVIRSHLTLNQEELEKLLTRYRNGDTSVKDDLIKSQIKFVLKICNKYVRNHLELKDDIYSIGFLSLIECVNTLYDTSKPFRNYIKDRINNKIRVFLKHHYTLVSLDNNEDDNDEYVDEYDISINGEQIDLVWLNEIQDQLVQYLSQEKRAILALYIQGYQIKDIASIYHINEKTIYNMFMLDIFPSLQIILERERKELCI